MGADVVTVNDVLDGHTTLDIQCLDRVYLNVYVPILQTSSQVVAFLSGHLGYPFASPALFNQIGQRFRKAVGAFAQGGSNPFGRARSSGIGAAECGSFPFTISILCRRWVSCECHTGVTLFSARRWSGPVRSRHG
jgi:hypothetical protein